MGGIFVATCDSRFQDVASPSVKDSTYLGSGSAVSVSSGRISFVLGLHGPCQSLDTACSSGLVALHGAVTATRVVEAEFSLAAGIILQLVPAASIVFATLGMTSPAGKCHTMDARADGYGRAEGCCALVAQLASGGLCCHAVLVRQDGRSASLTAPNGVAQAELLMACIDYAQPAQETLATIEVHGTGTVLGDPQEVGAVVAALKGSSMIVSSLKGNVSHTELAAGLAGLISLSINLAKGQRAANAQLRILNDHVKAAVGDERLHLPSHGTKLRRAEDGCSQSHGPSLAGGVSSFGWSGTLAHAIVSTPTHRLSSLHCSQLVMRRRVLSWRDRMHPMVQTSLLFSTEGLIFASPTVGALRSLVVDHVVLGRVLFPAAGYLEMTRAAVSYRAEPDEQTLTRLGGVLFLKPLALFDHADKQMVECVLRSTDETFEVRCGSRANSEPMDLHCQGTYAAGDSLTPQDVTWRRSHVVHAAHAPLLYSSSVLPHQHEFRTLDHVWLGAHNTATGLTKLRLRSQWCGTRIHPADLDGALQLGLVNGLVADVDGATVSRLPFAVEDAQLWGKQQRELWASAERQTSSTSDIELTAARRDRTTADLKGYKERTLNRLDMSIGAPQEFHYVSAWSTMPTDGTAAHTATLGMLLIEHAPAIQVDVPRSQSLESSTVPGTKALHLACVLAVALARATTVVNGLAAIEGALRVLCQAASATLSHKTSVWFVTVATQAAPVVQLSEQAGLWGLARSARAETKMDLTCIDLNDCTLTTRSLSHLGDVLYAVAISPDETELSLCVRASTVPRLQPWAPAVTGPFHLHLHSRGQVSNLVLEPLPSAVIPVGAGTTVSHPHLCGSEVDLEMHAVALNFRDVLNVLGEYPGDPGPPGGDCCGSTTAIGIEVSHLLCGGCSYGYANAPLCSASRTSSSLLASAPAALLFEEVCTLPTVWSTVHVAFNGIYAGDCILVHAAMGGVGVAAIASAHWMRSKVRGSAGQPLKHEQLQAHLGIQQRYSSRNGSALSLGVSSLQEGSRLHATLNSLSLDVISISLAALGEEGHFLELGKRGVWGELRQEVVPGRRLCHTIALDVDMLGDPAWMRSLLLLLSRRVEAGVVSSLPRQTFDMVHGYEQAFRLLLRGANVGKVVLRVIRMSKAHLRSADSACPTVELVTGGTAGLGLLTARFLAQLGAPILLLASRSGAIAEDMPSESAQLRASGARVLVERCHVADLEEAGRVATAAFPSMLSGVWHSAGVVADGLLPNTTAVSCCAVYAPKAEGAWNLHRVCTLLRMRACTLFSSVAGLVGGAGQSNYCAANCCLDSIALRQRAGGQVSLSIQWGAWAEIGMASRGAAMARVKRLKVDFLLVSQGLCALMVAVRPFAPAVLNAMPSAWAHTVGTSTSVPTLLSLLAPRRVHSQSVVACTKQATVSRAISLESVLKLVHHFNVFDADIPLMEAGVDSLGAVELRNLLKGVAGDRAILPSTVVFDHPTVRQLVAVLQSETSDSNEASKIRSVSPRGSCICDSLASVVEIKGLSALLPGCILRIDDGWRMIAGASDMMEEVPATRWDVFAPYYERALAATRHGGFVQGAELIDNEYFAFSSAEATAMDPQQRLVLERGYEVLHTTRADRESLNGSLTGVFLGIIMSDFSQLLAATPTGASVYAATGSSPAIACGRLSYILGLNGPSIAYDTACSASLVAVHGAVRVLKFDGCHLGLAAGVNLMLTPTIAACFALAGMTSARGRCHTFDARADGYARSEACASVSLAYSEMFTAAVVAVHGCAVRQDGRSASLTAPNGRAQQGLLSASLLDAAATPDLLAVAETHGTGTALGDPIEAGSLLGAVLSKRQSCESPVVVSGIKACLGHAEPVAGMTGLLQLALGWIHERGPSNAQLRVINPHVNSTEQGMGCVLPAQLAPMDNGPTRGALRCGVSSFGYAGTIVHAALASAKVLNNSDSGLILDELYKYKRRAFLWPAQRKSSSPDTIAPSDPNVSSGDKCLRWLYEVEWCCVHDALSPATSTSDIHTLLLVGAVPLVLAVPSHNIQLHDSSLAHTLKDSRLCAIVFTASLPVHDTPASSGSCFGELCVVDMWLSVLRSCAALDTPPPIWICTASTQPTSGVRQNTPHSGLWGASRACRPERAELLLSCIDVCDATDHHGLAGVLSRHTLTLSGGEVTGLQLKPTVEPEAAFLGSLQVPRMVMPHSVLSESLAADMVRVRRHVDDHLSTVIAALDLKQLMRSYRLLQSLCQQYVRRGLHRLHAADVPVWHHRLLYKWCAKQLLSSPDADAEDSQADRSVLWAELPLAEVCGACLADALTGSVAYQELLFPGGSMELTRPVYEEAVTAVFFNGCIIAAVESVLTMLPARYHVAALEVGAGTGGTASSVLPVVEGSCERYVFTDVSEFFLRQARNRFVEHGFIEYALLNIDADPRFQGFGSKQYDVIIATNVLHATPLMRNTLRHCEQLLRPAGLLLVNEVVRLSAFGQITFGLTDGWWLFSESRDAERIGQDSPLLSWRQWESLLSDSGFEASHCMQGDGFLRDQAVIVAQVATLALAERAAALGSGAHFLSGGLGGLGLLTARLLIEGGARQLVLSSRSDRVVAGSEGDWAWLSRSGRTIWRTRCDVSDEASVMGSVRGLLGDGLHVGGVFHAAHQIADAVLANQSALNFRVAYGPKVHGAQALHVAYWCAPLSFFNVFSSIAGLLGSTGQAPHSAANSWLDAMAGCRLQLGVRGQSVNWGAVAGIGFAARAGADTRAAAAGTGAISRAVTFAALCSTLIPASRCFAVLPADWSIALAGGEEARGCLAPYWYLGATANRGPAAASLSPVVNAHGTSSAVSLEALRGIICQTVGKTVDADAPLLEAGVDSLAMVELRTQLQLSAGDGVVLPATLVLDYPTARSLASFLQPPLSSGDAMTTLLRGLGGLSRQSPVIRGTAIIMPGGEGHRVASGEGVNAMWHMCAACVDAVVPVPTRRWDEGGQVYRAGLFSSIQLFDNAIFRISASEVAEADPGQRMLLERGYEALHDGSFTRSTLLGREVGVFLGIDKCDWMLASPPSTSVYRISSASNAIAVGRISFTFGLHGACSAYDAACASALVAAHGAVRALQSSECEAGLALGINVILSRNMHALFGFATLLSPSGRCHTFDHHADGMGRGEACAAIALGYIDGIPPGGLSMIGAAVRQDGRSSSLTAPSGPAQQLLFRAAFNDAEVGHWVTRWMECHGTGTKLGDPVEIGAAKASVLDGRTAMQTLTMGALKATTAHTEGCSGIPGLLKTARVLSLAMGPPNAALRVLNPFVKQALHGAQAGCLPVQMGALPNSGRRIGATNAFGFGGTIASHLLEKSAHAFGAPASMTATSMPLIFRRRDFSWRKEALAGQADATSLYFSCFVPRPHSSAKMTPCVSLCLAFGCCAQNTKLFPDLASAAEQWQRVTAVLSGDPSAAPALQITQAMIALVQQLACLSVKPRLLLLTCGARSTSTMAPPSSSDASLGGMGGLGRVVRLEHGVLRLLNAHSAHGPGASSTVLALMQGCAEGVERESEVAWSASSGRWVTRLRPGVPIAGGVAKHRMPGGTFALTGGLGGLGLRAATLLLKQGAVQVVLTSRSGRVQRCDQGLEEQLRTLDTKAKVLTSDGSASSETRALVSGCHTLMGVLHTAGVSEASLGKDLNAARMAWMFASKAFGALHLQGATAMLKLNVDVLFSSVGSGLGNIGQANYAAANGYLDVLTPARRAHGRVACSMQWPLVRGAGMGASACAALGSRIVSMTGMASISLERYAACLGTALFAYPSVECSVQLVHRLETSDLLLDLVDASHPRFSELISKHLESAELHCSHSASTPGSGGAFAMELAALNPKKRRASVDAAVMRAVRDVAGAVGNIHTETPLMNAGIDSLAATELSTRLSTLTGLALTPTLLFDEPTPRAITAHILEQLGEVERAPLPAAPLALGLDGKAFLAVASANGRWPGSCCSDIARMQLQHACGDALSAVPSARWTLEQAVDVGTLTAVQAKCVASGGFLPGVGRFDNLFFEISPVEVAAMDPQQRLLLEDGYLALHATNQRRASVIDSDTAVCLGSERPEWAAVMPPSARGSVYAISGDNVSVAAGRLCFTLGMQGPCATIDTACSSFLVALHTGAHAVKGGECSNVALALAVALKLSPLGTICAASLGMLSVNGRCMTFDARANGYARTEAVGALVLQQHDSGGVVAAAVHGCTVRQDGLSASLTAPNGSAQRKLLLLAQSRASVRANSMLCIEAHGTGTALGDPTEAGALVAVHGPGKRTAVCAAKASVGHSEAASGLVGVLRVCTFACRVEAVGNSQLRVLNPLVKRQLASVAVPLSCSTQLIAGEGMRGVVGISSFGFSGTIAHAVVEPSPIETDTTHSALQKVRSTLNAKLVPVSAPSPRFYRRQNFSWQNQNHAAASFRRVDGTRWVTLSGDLSPSKALARLADARPSKVVVVTMRNLISSSDRALDEMEVGGVLLATCQGSNCDAAGAILAQATVVFAYPDSTFHFSQKVAYALARVGRFGLFPKRASVEWPIDAAEAWRIGLVDFVGNLPDVQQRLALKLQQLGDMPADLLTIYRAELPAVSFEEGFLVAGAPALLRQRTLDEQMHSTPSLVQLSLHSGVSEGQSAYLTQAIISLNDPHHFNSFSVGLGDDMQAAVNYLRGLRHVASVALQGAGPHFSVGGNPYALPSLGKVDHASFARSLRVLYSGFIDLRILEYPVTGAIHGKVPSHSLG